jgi:hypothetical protein
MRYSNLVGQTIVEDARAIFDFLLEKSSDRIYLNKQTVKCIFIFAEEKEKLYYTLM